MFKEFNQKQLITYISRENKYDVVAFAITPWHAVGVSAVIDYLVDKNQKGLNCLIVICEHPSSGYALSDFHFNLNENCSYEFVMRCDRKTTILWKIWLLLCYFMSIFLNFKERSKKLYLLSSCKPIPFVSSILSVNLKRKVINYYYDEGLLTYFIKLGGYLNFTNKLNSIFSLCYKEKKPFTLFDFNKKEILKNENVLYYYRKQLEVKSRKLDCESLEGCVLVCTQMYSLDGEIKIEDESYIYDNIIAYCKRLGIGVKFKLHPRHKSLEYFNSIDRTMIYESNYPLEQILNQTKPICVISITSTVLVNSLLFFDVKTISISRILYFYKIGSCLKKDIESFVKIFSSYVEMPTTLSEMNKIISKYAEKKV